MERQLDLVAIIRETARGAVSALAPTLGWGLLFVGAYALSLLMIADGRFVPQSGRYIASALMIGVSCAWGAAIYRQLLAPKTGNSLAKDTGKLILANLLVFMAFVIVAFIAMLFLVIVSGILVVASGYDPSAADPSDISGSMDALRRSGAVWLLYGLIAVVAGVLVWFALRLVLYGAATIARGRVLVFQSWSLSKGAVVRIALLAGVFVAIPAAALMLAHLNHVPAVLWLAVPGGSVSLQGVLLGVALNAAAFLFGHSFAAALYRRLGAEDVAAAI